LPFLPFFWITFSDHPSAFAPRVILFRTPSSLLIFYQVLSDQDYVTIISFGSAAKVELPKTHMTPDGKSRACDVIDSLLTNGNRRVTCDVIFRPRTFPPFTISSRPFFL
jgi:hypothetical protein